MQVVDHSNNANTLESKAVSILEQVYDPEIPVLSIVDLGIVHKIEIRDGLLNIDLMPTYIGCPAMDLISMQVSAVLYGEGFRNYTINLINDPIWHSGMISQKGLDNMQKYGIVKPDEKSRIDDLILGQHALKCPNCASENTIILSPFGSTACKSLFKCNDCLEPFEYFKCNSPKVQNN